MRKWIDTWIENSLVPLPYGIVFGVLVVLYAAFADSGHPNLALITFIAAAGFYTTAPNLPKSH